MGSEIIRRTVFLKYKEFRCYKKLGSRNGLNLKQNYNLLERFPCFIFSTRASSFYTTLGNRKTVVGMT